MVLGAKEEHEDWHYAKALQAQVNSTGIAHDSQLNTTIISPPARRKGHNVGQARGKTEKGQSRLVFGR
jgi:hypothetical protein